MAHTCKLSTQEAEVKQSHIKAILDYIGRRKGKRKGKERRKEKK
jgi:hypothetical protein